MSKISPDTLLTLEAYSRARPQLRTEAIQCKQQRSVFIGPHVTLQFENETTIRYQIQEMLRIEKTFDADGIADELDAYNPLIPDGNNWKATQLIEFTDEEERKRQLVALKNIENRTYIQVSGQDRVYAIADEDMARSNADKTSAVHFMRFQLSPEMVAAVKNGAAIAMGIDHPAYNHRVDEISPETQGSLVEDLA